MDPEIQKQFDEIRSVLANTAQLQRETAVKQDRNAEAISQQLEMISQMRQTIVEQGRQIQDNRADIARLDNSGDGALN